MPGAVMSGDGLGRRLVPDDALPAWLRPMVSRLDGSGLPPWVLHALDAAPEGARRGAVLLLLAEGLSGPDLLLTARAASLRSHAGQPAFPGGAVDPGETDTAAALREAREEADVDPAGVLPVAEMPSLYLPPSRFLVRPVIAHWRTPGPVRAVDPAETERVLRVPLAELADPANRGSVTLPAGGDRGLVRRLQTPAFRVQGLTVWGFTAGLVDLLLEWGGWAQPWDRSRELVPESLPSVLASRAAASVQVAASAPASVQVATR